jgi:hypothetical protein
MASSDVWYACYEINANATYSSNTWLCQGPYETLSVADKCSTECKVKDPAITIKASRKVALSAPSYIPQALQEVLISKSLQRLLRQEICFQRDPPSAQQQQKQQQQQQQPADWNAH